MYTDKVINIFKNGKIFSFFNNENKSFNCYPIKINVKGIVENNIFITGTALILSTTYSGGVVLDNIFLNLLNCKNFIVPIDTFFDPGKTNLFLNKELTLAGFLTINYDNNFLKIDSKYDNATLNNFNGSIDIIPELSISINDENGSPTPKINSVLLKNTLYGSAYIPISNIKKSTVYTIHIKSGDTTTIKIPKSLFSQYEFFYIEDIVVPSFLTSAEKDDTASFKYSGHYYTLSLQIIQGSYEATIYFEKYGSLITADWLGVLRWNRNFDMDIVAYEVYDEAWN